MMTTTNHSFALDGDDAARELREITRIGAIRGSAGDDSNSTHAPGHSRTDVRHGTAPIAFRR